MENNHNDHFVIYIFPDPKVKYNKTKTRGLHLVAGFHSNNLLYKTSPCRFHPPRVDMELSPTSRSAVRGIPWVSLLTHPVSSFGCFPRPVHSSLPNTPGPPAPRCKLSWNEHPTYTFTFKYCKLSSKNPVHEAEGRGRGVAVESVRGNVNSKST